MSAANDLGEAIAKGYELSMACELAEACHVQHLPTARQAKQIMRIVETRVKEAAEGTNPERHAMWFMERNQGAFRRSIRQALGHHVDVHYKDGAPSLIRRRHMNPTKARTGRGKAQGAAEGTEGPPRVQV